MKRIRHDLNEAFVNKSNIGLNEHWKNRLADIFQQESKKLIVVAYLKLNDLGMAQDACQNAFYKILALSNQRLEEIKDLRYYIFRVLSNEAARMKKKRLSDLTREPLAYSNMQFLAESLESRRRTKLIMDKLKDILKPKEFEIIFLWACGHTYADIAEVMRKRGEQETQTTIRGKIGRIKSKMRSKFNNTKE
ncbi:MAG: sigma-70 family RNA polymerase sigma factor [Bacteroidota bacterium]